MGGVRRGSGWGGRAAQQGPQARQQFFGDERLGQIVIGPGTETFKLVGKCIARRQHQNRGVDPFVAQCVADADAIAKRQHDIK